MVIQSSKKCLIPLENECKRLIVDNETHHAYTIEPYDDGRWIVTRTQSDMGYVVEIDFDEARHRCGCKYYEYKPHGWGGKPCRHIKMVLELLRKGDPDAS